MPKNSLRIALKIAVFGVVSVGTLVAQTVRCGQVLTKDTSLSRVLNCQGTALYVGAHGITIDLNGHKISGDGSGMGIRNDGILPDGYNGTGGYDWVTIRDGVIEYFDTGVFLGTTSYNTLSGLTIRLMKRNPWGTGAILTVANDHARVRFNLIEHNDRGGISVDGGFCSEGNGDGKPACVDNRIEENKIFGNARGIENDVYYGLQLYLARGVVANKNEIYGHVNTLSKAANAAGILVVGSSQNFFSENKLEDNTHGVLLTDEYLTAGQVSTANIFYRNLARFNFLQAYEFRPGASAIGMIAENLASDNHGGGFLFLFQGAPNSTNDFFGFTLYRNVSQGNGMWGFAALSAVDGTAAVPPRNLGENVASSNRANPQCVGFACVG